MIHQNFVEAAILYLCPSILQRMGRACSLLSLLSQFVYWGLLSYNKGNIHEHPSISQIPLFPGANHLVTFLSTELLLLAVSSPPSQSFLVYIRSRDFDPEFTNKFHSNCYNLFIRHYLIISIQPQGLCMQILRAIVNRRAISLKKRVFPVYTLYIIFSLLFH